ncbi:hypothetical protein BAE44_0000658 [Dichanthelium oligosanthes]|uniref:Uncharacterized protein n=1 Tax=Dichanthelium oligosanthes TaxID=888268 RepID=A0A1E5WLU9_9POAL|nr:hypothetical protein BAE44_0000658 [Dichanthelium oligosanthes]
MSRADLSCFLVVAWAVHPDLIPQEVMCVVPEPEVPFVEGESPLFLRASELVHSKRDSLQFIAIVHLLEVHDFSLPSDSNDSSGSSDSSGADGLPRSGSTHLKPWPRMYNLAGRLSPSGEPWPSLPRTGWEASWSTPALEDFSLEGRFGRALAGESQLLANRVGGSAVSLSVDLFCCIDRDLLSSLASSATAPDPMLLEASLSPAAFAPLGSPAFEGAFHGSGPSSVVDTTILDSAPLDSAPLQPVPQPAPSLDHSALVQVVTTSRNASPESLPPDAFPTSPLAFAQAVGKPLGVSILPAPPPLRQPRN